MSSSELPSEALIIEGGGSHTSMALYADESIVFELHGATSNPRSVSESEATDTLGAMLAEVQHHADGKLPVFAAHGAASTKDEARWLGRTIVSLMDREKFAQVIVVNDLVPVVLSQPGTVLVAAAGTGTGFMARGKAGDWHRASGLEYMLADEGGGFELGQGVLRAVVRDLDGRGRPTMLTELVAGELECQRSDLPGALYHHVYRNEAQIKHTVASFAQLVFDADRTGDEAAVTLLDKSASEIARGINAMERAVGGADEERSMILTGSLLTEQKALRQRLVEQHGLHMRFAVTVLDSMDLLQTTAQLVRIDDTVTKQLAGSEGMPFYFERGDSL